ncbi:MAG: hypothetical protein WBS22_18470 [Methylocystis sp.]
MSVSGMEKDWLLDPREGPIEARPFGVRASLGLGASAMAVLLGFWAFSGRPSETGPSPAPQARASAAAEPAVQFDLRAPEFSGLPRSVANSDEGAVRIDSLTIGQFGLGGAFARFDLRQASGDARANPEFTLDLGHEAEQAGLKIAKSGQPSPFASRFGAFEAAEAKISGKSAAGASLERDCQTLRLAGAKLGVEIAGVVCAGPGQTFDRRTLGCLVDQLSFRSNGGTPTVDKFFALAEPLRGQACAQAAVSSEKADWMAAHSVLPAAPSPAPPVKTAKKTR